ncbi:hypothetical protein ACIP5Y_40930 [Nocardia sp. NPDC088792]|uniref:hypothetical protein n=1 Tax=Nocardia sp. NPDC088792 TaxID=3364332 RepID=UPI003823A0FC
MNSIGKLVAFAAMAVLALTGIAFGKPVTPMASADPAPDGCVIDTTVPNQATLTCPPGAGHGQHAFISCRDIGGLLHTRIGPTLGADGGVSQANCAYGETGPA